MSSAWIQARTVARIGGVSTPPQSVIMPRNFVPLITVTILNAYFPAEETSLVWRVNGGRPGMVGDQARQRNVSGVRYNDVQPEPDANTAAKGVRGHFVIFGSGSQEHALDVTAAHHRPRYCAPLRLRCPRRRVPGGTRHRRARPGG